MKIIVIFTIKKLYLHLVRFLQLGFTIYPTSY